MPVIKADNLAAQRNVGAFSMADIERQARGILAAAAQRAQGLLAEAQREAEEMKRAAHAQALAEGKRQGLAEGTAKGLADGKKQGHEQALAEHREALAGAVAAVTEAAGQIEQSRVLLETDGRQAVAELALAIAGKVARRQGQLDPQVLLNNVDDALRLVVSSTDVRIAVHPEQRATLEAALPAIGASWPKFKHVELIEDAGLAPGGCRVHTVGGQVNADLEVQLERIAAELVPGGE